MWWMCGEVRRVRRIIGNGARESIKRQQVGEMRGSREM